MSLARAYVGPAYSPDRGVLPAQLQSRSQPRRATQCRPEVHAGLKGTDAHQRQAQGGDKGAYGFAGKRAQTRALVLR